MTGAVASFHLVRERPGRAPLALARLGLDRWRLPRVPGLVFWRLLGAGRGADTAAGSADLRRTALFARWEREEALDAFLASPLARRWDDAEEAYTVRLRALGGAGRWRGVDVLDGLVEGDPGGPVAVLTRADVRLRHWPTFVHAGRAVAPEARAAPGLLRVVGIGEAPVLRQATFSLWRSAADVQAFAYRMPRHADVVRRTRAEGWYGEALFARFEPYASEGTWAGADPLR